MKIFFHSLSGALFFLSSFIFFSIMGCCPSSEPSSEEERLLSKDYPSTNSPVPAQSRNVGMPQGRGRGERRGEGGGPFVDNMESRATPIQEEKRLADLASQTQRDFISIPPSSFPEGRFEAEYMQEREEYYRSNLDEKEKREKNVGGGLPKGLVGPEEVVKVMVAGKGKGREEEFLGRVSGDLERGLDGVKVADVGPLVTSFEV